MYQGGDAAEQIVRVSIEGIEMAAKVVGSGAKELATFLFAVLRDSGHEEQQKGPLLKGRERLSAMLKSGKELKVFALKEKDLKEFCDEAKSFGVGYCVVRHKNKNLDGLCDVMVSAEQASMVARIVERFGYQPTDRATLQTEIERDRGVKEKDPAVFQQELAERDAKRGAPPQAVRQGPSRDGAARPGPTPSGLPAPGSGPRSNSEEPSKTAASKKPSIKDRLDGIIASMQRRQSMTAPQHQPHKKSRKKSKGAKSHG